MSVIESLSGFALRILRPEQFEAVRGLYRGIRQRAAPLLRATYGSFDTEQLRQHLQNTVGSDFDVMMVHCSVNNLQPMYSGNPLELLRMLIDYCGPQRTLAMPAFYFGEPGSGDAAEAFRLDPRFDLRRTPSQMGLLSELFRRWRGSVCSRHPIYRVCALGPRASDLVHGHEQAPFPCGVGSPFDYMARHDTLILGMGKPFEVLTHVHHAEDVLGDSFPVPARQGPPIEMTLIDGPEETPMTLRPRTFQWKRDMWRLRSIMNPATLREWRFHGVPMFATRAADVSKALIAAAKSGTTLYVAD